MRQNFFCGFLTSPQSSMSPDIIMKKYDSLQQFKMHCFSNVPANSLIQAHLQFRGRLFGSQKALFLIIFSSVIRFASPVIIWARRVSILFRASRVVHMMTQSFKFFSLYLIWHSSRVFPLQS
ncbi:hypothetical protein TNCV_2877761 [Trichonephila clavipes]|uniref:Uncharacterized protein n=1 Tax=Trichonephila clavipes TaxID=2585209 RepID=A0A8X6W1T3_TRICX|nr:hypothetical protein TNCV_2877761 [Trichonephila clavipes]